MRLRKLKLKDAEKMYAWMHDESVVKYMGTNFAEKTIENCFSFIKDAQFDCECLHRAIVNDNDEYMGTVSLKNIDHDNLSAEFAITVGKDAMGKGFSQYGMNTIINYGFQELNLQSIYWYVNACNKRAIRFYEKCGYKRLTQPVKNRWVDISKIDESMIWFEVRKENWK